MYSKYKKDGGQNEKDAITRVVFTFVDQNFGCDTA